MQVLVVYIVSTGDIHCKYWQYTLQVLVVYMASTGGIHYKYLQVEIVLSISYHRDRDAITLLISTFHSSSCLNYNKHLHLEIMMNSTLAIARVLFKKMSAACTLFILMIPGVPLFILHIKL